MTRNRTLLLFLLAVSMVAPSPAFAQNVDLSDFPKFDLDDIGEDYRKWVEEEVVWIITNDERDVFVRLDTDARRDRFIEGFWAQRDPSPGTVDNEYLIEHYSRLAYIERYIGRDTPRPGWDTDQGRMYSLLGKPRGVTRLPSTDGAVPVEIWFYSVDPGLIPTPFFNIVFFKERGYGAYRLWSPAMDGVIKLLNPAVQTQVLSGSTDRFGGRGGIASTADGLALQMLSQIDTQLAQAARSLVPGEGLGVISPLRSEMLLQQVFQIPDKIMPRATWAYNVLTGVTESDVRFETLPISAIATVLIDPSGLPFIHHAFRTEGDRLNLNHYEDKYYFTFRLGSTIRDAQLRSLHERQPRALQADIDAETTRRLRGGPVAYMERLPAISGDHTLSLMVENNVSHEFAQFEIRLPFPRVGGEELAAGEPLLVRQVADAPDGYSTFSPQQAFQVGAHSMVPAIGNDFAANGTATVFQQLFVPPDRIAPVMVRTVVRGAGRETLIEKVDRVESSLRDENGVINYFAEISLQQLPPGDYSLTTEVEEIEGSTTMGLRIVTAARYKRPYVHSLPNPPASSPRLRVARARQLRVAGRTDEAISELAYALQREPDLQPAVELQIELLQDAGRYGELNALLRPRVAEDPNNSELLILLGEVNALLAEHYDAIRFYERARIAGADETTVLLNALAAEYFADGRVDRTRDLVLRSLEIEPDQPQMQRLLDAVMPSEEH